MEAEAAAEISDAAEGGDAIGSGGSGGPSDHAGAPMEDYDDTEVESLPTEDDDFVIDEDMDMLEDPELLADSGGQVPDASILSGEFEVPASTLGNPLSSGPGGAASSSGDIAADAVASQGRSPALAVTFVPGGKLSCYSGRAIVEAVCSNPAHGKCVMTRTLMASSTPGRAGQGRPLGFLAAWLAAGLDAPTKAVHWAASGVAKSNRQAARSALRAAPGGDALLSLERVRREGEDSEPDEVP